MYVPFCRSSLANCGSTNDTLRVDFFALSRGTICPQLTHCTKPLLPLLPFDLPRLFRLNGITFDLLAFYTQIVKLLLYISARIFRRYAMLALESILGIIFPDGEVIRLVTPGPWPAVTQLVCTTMPTEMAPSR